MMFLLAHILGHSGGSDKNNRAADRPREDDGDGEVNAETFIGTLARRLINL